MTFAELLQTEKPVLIDFYADWCAPCRAMKPILEDLKTRIGEDALVYKIDVDRNPSVAEAYKVMSIPTLIIFKNGEPVCRKSGIAPANELLKLLSEHIPTPAK
ncbi:MAG: thioredoxin [Bacteroidota bacterium]